jgi:hypothetical protein
MRQSWLETRKARARDTNGQGVHWNWAAKYTGLFRPRFNLSIHDKGIGFDSGNRVSGHGRGMVNLQERAQLVHGEFSVYPEPVQGTEIRVFVSFMKATS